MHAMQYEIALPADYDMGIIRDRVATRGHALDGFAGLGLKAYLIRERGVQGSPVNAYAPFYVWADTHGMSRFLFGGAGFGGVVASFGRPVVRQWSAFAFRQGPSVAASPRAAVKRAELLPPDADPQEAAERAVAELDALGRAPGLHSAVACIDPTRWELMLFSLWEVQAPEECGSARYQVLRLSRPEMAALD